MYIILDNFFNRDDTQEDTSVKFIVGPDGVQVRREKGGAQSRRGTDGQQMQNQRTY